MDKGIRRGNEEGLQGVREELRGIAEKQEETLKEIEMLRKEGKKKDLDGRRKKDSKKDWKCLR